MPGEAVRRVNMTNLDTNKLMPGEAVRRVSKKIVVRAPINKET